MPNTVKLPGTEDKDVWQLILSYLHDTKDCFPDFGQKHLEIYPHQLGFELLNLQNANN
jgi:hypothetical protein